MIFQEWVDRTGFSEYQLFFLELDILQNDEVVGNLKVNIKRDESMDIDGINVPVLSVRNKVMRVSKR